MPRRNSPSAIRAASLATSASRIVPRPRRGVRCRPSDHPEVDEADAFADSTKMLPGCGSAWKNPCTNTIDRYASANRCATDRRSMPRRLERAHVVDLDAADALLGDDVDPRVVPEHFRYVHAVVVAETRSRPTRRCDPRGCSRARRRSVAPNSRASPTGSYRSASADRRAATAARRSSMSRSMFTCSITPGRRTFTTTSGTVGQRRGVDLADRCGRERHEVEPGERVVERRDRARPRRRRRCRARARSAPQSCSRASSASYSGGTRSGRVDST